MRVKSVTFGFTKNLGNYQSARADCTVEFREDEADSEAVDRGWILAAAQVKATLGEGLDPAEAGALQAYEKGTL